MGTPTAIEELIRSAFERGDFDDLQGNGKPLDLREYFNTPEDLRLAFSILKNAGILPVEIEGLKQVKGLREEMEKCKDESEKLFIRKKISELLLNFNIYIENQKKH